MDSKNLTAALAYAKAGYKVIPVAGKIPLTPHGAHDATTDESIIRDWWQRWPNANIAITLAGLVVVDIDPRNGGSVSALKELPATCTAKTGGNGWHYLFKAKTGAHYPGKLAQGVDQKTGPGAYIVVAPSLHASGNCYQWITSPLDIAPAIAPDWMQSAPTKSVISSQAKTKSAPVIRSEYPSDGWIAETKTCYVKTFTVNI